MEEMDIFLWYFSIVPYFLFPDGNKSICFTSEFYNYMSDGSVVYCSDTEKHRVLFSTFSSVQPRTSSMGSALYWIRMHDWHIWEKYDTKESNTESDVLIKGFHGLSCSSCNGFSALRKDLLYVLLAVIMWHRVFSVMLHVLISPSFRVVVAIHSYTFCEFSESHSYSKEKCPNDEKYDNEYADTCPDPEFFI